jgi:hypothetical protein
VKTEQGALQMENNGTSSEDDNTRLTREVESLKRSIQALTKDREEHISIMRHLVHDMLQNHVELSDIVRERLERHVPGVLPNRPWETLQNYPIPHHVRSYPYTPSRPSATPTIVKRERDSSLKAPWTRSPSTAVAQDLRRNERDFLPSPAKRQRTGFAAQDSALFSTVPDSQPATPRFAPSSVAGLIPHFDQPIRKQATPKPNHSQSLSFSEMPQMPLIAIEDTEGAVMPGGEDNLQREFAHPEGTKPPPSIDSTSKKCPSYQFNNDPSDCLADLATREAGDEVLDIHPAHGWQESTEYITGYANDPSDTSLYEDWTFFDDSLPLEQ